MLESLTSAGGTKQHIDNEKRMSGREVTEAEQELNSSQTVKSGFSKSKKVF